jgi:hypothetical protein
MSHAIGVAHATPGVPDQLATPTAMPHTIKGANTPRTIIPVSNPVPACSVLFSSRIIFAPSHQKGKYGNWNITFKSFRKKILLKDVFTFGLVYHFMNKMLRVVVRSRRCDVEEITSQIFWGNVESNWIVEAHRSTDESFPLRLSGLDISFVLIAIFEDEKRPRRNDPFVAVVGV